jgi:hypothetical protein
VNPNNSKTLNITASYTTSSTPTADIHATNEESEPRLLQNGTSTPSGSQAVIANSSNGITPDQIAKCDVLAASESVLSEKLGLAKEPEEDGIRTLLSPGAEDKLRPAKLHRLGPKERKTVDQVLDEQRRQGHLVDAKGSQAIWPVFFVKRCSEWKAVVDFRTLNQSIVSETYPSPLRTDGRSRCANQTVDAINVAHPEITASCVNSKSKSIPPTVSDYAQRISPQRAGLFNITAMAKKRLNRCWKKVEHPVHYKDGGMEVDTRIPVDELDNCQKLAKGCECEHASGNTSWQPRVKMASQRVKLTCDNVSLALW